MLADSVDFDINYMAALIFTKNLDLRKMLILGQPPKQKQRYNHVENH